MKKLLITLLVLPLLACHHKPPAVVEPPESARAIIYVYRQSPETLFTLTLCLHADPEVSYIEWKCHVIGLEAEPNTGKDL